MKYFDIQTSMAEAFLPKGSLKSIEHEAVAAYETLTHRKGAGKEFLGWVDLPLKMDPTTLAQIRDTASRLRDKASTLVVIGIGGSYLGAKAVIEALESGLHSLSGQGLGMEILYAGHHLGSAYHEALLSYLDTRSYALCVISKSGTTTEPALAFRFLKKHLEEKYGVVESARRIVAITDAKKGALRDLADANGYQTFIIPDDVGGRFSVLSPVGLLPIAAAAHNIDELMAGAVEMRQMLLKNTTLAKNPAIQYAAMRNLLYREGYSVEVLASYLPQMAFVAEWFKQLYGESEGKEGKGIFPASVNLTTDLHSMGQYIQDGKRFIFETILSVKKHGKGLKVEKLDDDADGLNYLAGKSLHQINLTAEEGTTMAHRDGKVPIIQITIDSLNEKALGALLYFFEFACALSGYMLGVNPFDQPGVEDYKRNMFALLGKPGYSL